MAKTSPQHCHHHRETRRVVLPTTTTKTATKTGTAPRVTSNTRPGTPPPPPPRPWFSPLHLVLASFPAAAASASETAAVADKYVPSPMDPTWQVGIEDDDEDDDDDEDEDEDEDEVSRALAPLRSPSYLPRLRLRLRRLLLQVYVGAAVGTFPFVIATYEFSKRVIIQRRCRVCNGTGLVLKGKSNYYKKCRECGGFLPWLGWRAFFTGSFTGIANGSPVLPPKGQTSVFYSVTRAAAEEEREDEEREDGEREDEERSTTTTTTTTATDS